MKKLLTLLISTISMLAYTQMDCVDLSPYTVGYLNNVTTDHTTYPAGTAFITTGDISYVKPNTTSYYQGILGDSLFYIGDIDIDVSAASCSDKVLTFSCMYLEGLSVDGDTLFTSLNPPAFYTGAGFSFQYLGNGDYLVSGDFDVVSLYTQTNYLFDVCLDCNPPTPNCISLAPYTESYLNDVSTDHTTYPVGTAFVTTGDISYVKPDQMSYYQFIQGDTLMYVGNIDIDVSASTCGSNVLEFSSTYNIGMAVDGDTIFTGITPPATYAGNGWTFYHLGGEDFRIVGGFDVVSIYSSTNFLFDVCLSCMSSGPGCVSLDPYTEAYLNDVSTDHTTYPVGTAFVTTGDISYVKPDQMSYYQFIQGDTLMYVGNIDIDISASSCIENILTFSSTYNLGMAVDGDTIFTGMTPPATYAGNGWTFEYLGGEDFRITGEFDVVSIYSSTNFLFDVCLDCQPIAGIAEESAPVWNVFPNPSEGVFTVLLPNSRNAEFSVLDLTGRTLKDGVVGKQQLSIDLRDEPDGIYFLLLRGIDKVHSLCLVKQ